MVKLIGVFFNKKDKLSLYDWKAMSKLTKWLTSLKNMFKHHIVRAQQFLIVLMLYFYFSESNLWTQENARLNL